MSVPANHESGLKRNEQLQIEKHCKHEIKVAEETQNTKRYLLQYDERSQLLSHPPQIGRCEVRKLVTPRCLHMAQLIFFLKKNEIIQLQTLDTYPLPQLYAMNVSHHPTPSPALQRALNSALPYSINLVYRTQHRNRTAHANVLATFPPDTPSPPKCWAAAYFDRSMRPETEMWIFAAGEMPDHTAGEGFCAECRRAVMVLLDYMGTLETPPMREDNMHALDLAYQHEKECPGPPDGEYPPSPGVYMRHLLLPKVVLIGACHEQIVQICREEGLVRREFPGANMELNKFIFKLSNLPATRELPRGLRWGQLKEEQDIETVKARTSIPRSTKTLLSLENVGVFEDESNKPIGWTFLGIDGSLTTLHTEPEHRGKGIAKAVGAKIMREYASGLAVDDDGNAWSHADVYAGNIQSESVCSSLGGKALWKDYWVRIDLDRVESVANGV
jgi:ribosomal protein S18 acetylase RimI-like enzyme